ncbi:acyl-CoA N-acyltransferase [Astrocystis sublimbata]|nr:acyl-CoA N-acyltransferase [Astrocystis sublimbata]
MQSEPRIADQGDLAAVRRIVEDAYTPYVKEIGQKPGPLLDDYETLVASRRVTVAEIDGVVQGILVLVPEEGAMLLDNVAVASSARGQGLGRLLIAHAEECARIAGYASIRLCTNEAMAANIEHYARIGYEETHRGEEAGFKRVYMTKTLV